MTTATAGTLRAIHETTCCGPNEHVTTVGGKGYAIYVECLARIMLVFEREVGCRSVAYEQGVSLAPQRLRSDVRGVHNASRISLAILRTPRITSL